MLRIPEDSRPPRRAVISEGNFKNIGTFRVNPHLSSGSRMDMSLQRKPSNSAELIAYPAEYRSSGENRSTRQIHARIQPGFQLAKD